MVVKVRVDSARSARVFGVAERTFSMSPDTTGTWVLLKVTERSSAVVVVGLMDGWMHHRSNRTHSR